MELSDSKIKKFLIFSRKKAFPIFREMRTSPKFIVFEKLFYFWGNGNPEKILYISGK